MDFILTSPSIDDVIRLLKAWRFWVLSALLGALIGVAIYLVAPPPYRARATVNVDFNLEQAWPEETDRQQFYYLERETRKLEEIAWSDAVMQTVVDADGHTTVNDLRGGQFQLSQPGEAGWHFYADDADPERAASLAALWAQAFAAQAQARIEDGTINPYVTLEVMQSIELPIERSLPLSSYLLTGSFGCMALGALAFLLFGTRRHPDHRE
jgi:hypothetical protein